MQHYILKLIRQYENISILVSFGQIYFVSGHCPVVWPFFCTRRFSWKVQIKFQEKCTKAFQIRPYTMPVGEIIYSERYEDEEFEYRHVKLFLLNTNRG